MFILDSYYPCVIDQSNFLPSCIAMTQGELLDNITQLVILARQDECLESYCRTAASVCVCTKTLTLPITHELLWVELSYFTCVFF